MKKKNLSQKVLIVLFFVNLITYGAVFAQKNKYKELSKKTWTITASSFRPQTPPSLLLDNNMATVWHTPTGASASGYPHWFTIDMKESVKVSEVVLHKRPKIGNGFGDFEIWGSEDGEKFTQYGETYTLDQGNDMDYQPQHFKIKETPTIRYIKIVPLKVAKTWSSQTANYTVLAEFGVIGAKK